MDKRQIGRNALIDVIGRDFLKAHKDAAIFSCGDTEKGFFCFIGIDLHPETRCATLSVPIDDWDIYASCYVLDVGTVVMDECRLPEE